jgi:hypothetical protein
MGARSKLVGYASRVSDVMARQLAKLLADSDLDELREIVEEWRKTAPDAATRKQYDALGARLIELKSALAESPTQPTRDELEVALMMMMKLAAEQR